jgi:hypothetical protein
MHTNKQTIKHDNKQTNKQTNTQKYKHEMQQANKKASKDTHTTHTYKHTNEPHWLSLRGDTGGVYPADPMCHWAMPIAPCQISFTLAPLRGGDLPLRKSTRRMQHGRTNIP